MDRFDPQAVEDWRREGAALMPGFFTPDEISAVRADFETVFARTKGAARPLDKKRAGETGAFHHTQFLNFRAVPLECSPALNLIGVHPALIRFAKAALGTDDVHLYQCQAWAKFTGEADYDQPFHCDFVNHTLVGPSEQQRYNPVTVISYFSDVTEAHGPMHYVPRSQSEDIAGPEASHGHDPAEQAALQARLAPRAVSTASAAGTAFAYGIDVYHRGTNLTAPRGHRYAVTACFKDARDSTLGYHAWPFHHTQPWANVFDHASPEQLACFGVHPPGHPFWTETTLKRAQARYPNWDLSAYRAAMA